MRKLTLLAVFAYLLTGCADDKVPAIEFPADWIGGTCGALFGRPSASTGLDGDHCQPGCGCEGLDFQAPDYTQNDTDALLHAELLNPLEMATYDPYETPDLFAQDLTKVCAVVWDSEVKNGYRLETFDDDATAAAAGAQVTHYGQCGACSSFQDLHVYITKTDLTAPVRNCAMAGFTSDEKSLTCLEDLGFSPQCAEIWHYNARHTRVHCLKECLPRLKDPHHTADGRLNPCIQCDEDTSGGVFKAVAGRTRRNSGLAAALCRPCEDVFPLVHRYTAP